MNHYFERLRRIQYEILSSYPFYGKLLLSLPFALNPKCKTAYTDMKHIVFDPSFIDQLDDIELKVLILHELLHCVLFHPTRQKGKIHLLYNIACDIVVNSIIYQDIPINSLGGSPFVHTFEQKEGYLYTADEIYLKLLNLNNEYENILVDNHDVWEIKCKDQQMEEDFNEILLKTYKTSKEDINKQIRKILEERYEPKMNWQEQLMDFLSYNTDQEDYSYSVRDTRFYDDTYLPSLIEEDNLFELNKIYIAIDVSGSISDEQYNEFVKEIQYQCEMMHIKGYYSFFDTKVTEPKPFDEENKIDFKQVNGYGGTSFSIIFQKTKEFFEDPPKAIIILTDGYAVFPKSVDYPVVWVINNNDITPPYGKILRMNK